MTSWMSRLALSGHSRHCNILSVIRPKRTLANRCRRPVSGGDATSIYPRSRARDVDNRNWRHQTSPIGCQTVFARARRWPNFSAHFEGWIGAAEIAGASLENGRKKGVCHLYKAETHADLFL